MLAVNPSPVNTPTWENLVPWLFGFGASLISSFAYYLMIQQGKRLDNIDERVDKLADALYLTNKVRLLQMAADVNMHPVLKEQVDATIREIEDATRKK